MAGDWIKFRKCVITHPRLVRTMSALNADRLRTLGGIVSAWCLLDEQTSDGTLDGYTPEILDELVGLPGLSRAMEAAGWLIITETGLQAPEFEKHNGATAKRRAQENVRKMSARNADKCPHDVREMSALEKRREEKRKKSDTPKPPKGASANKSSDPRHHAITSEIKERFRNATGIEFVFDDRGVKELTKLLAAWSGTIEAFWDIAEKAWALKADPYATGCKKSGVLSTLCTNWGLIQSEIVSQAPKRNGWSQPVAPQVTDEQIARELAQARPEAWEHKTFAQIHAETRQRRIERESTPTEVDDDK